jgi:hypothetical protein
MILPLSAASSSQAQRFAFPIPFVSIRLIRGIRVKSLWNLLSPPPSYPFVPFVLFVLNLFDNSSPHLTHGTHLAPDMLSPSPRPN